MNAALRAHAVVADPSAAWAKIENEPGDAAYLLTGYAAPLALIPAVFSLIGACVVGVDMPGAGTVRAPIFDGVFGAIFGYVMTCATVLVLGLLINLGRRCSAGGGILIVRSSSRSIHLRRSGWQGFSWWRRDCAFSDSPAYTAPTFCGRGCRG